MAGHGPPPKPDAERARRNAPPVPEVSVTPDDVLRGPDLPDDLRDAEGDHLSWPSMTRRWWLNWRRSPQAQSFTATDWDFLLETALLHRDFVLGDARVASELRLRVAKFGATPEDRLRLRMSITPPAAPVTTASVKSDEVAEKREDRRKRLERAAGE